MVGGVAINGWWGLWGGGVGVLTVVGRWGWGLGSGLGGGLGIMLV